MANRYRFEKDYTHIVRDPKTGLVTGHVDYKAGHEGLLKDEHVEGADAAGAGAVTQTAAKALGMRMRLAVATTFTDGR
jgi:hypothetical protein